jgi:alpha-methylacyl-CoA racemase
VLELAGIGPGPFGCMLLADLGASVVQVARVGHRPEIPARGNLLNRGKRSLLVDLKSPAGIEVVLRLAESSDAFVDVFRPGVTERLGLGPDVVRARNARAVYARMTGWGQDGPLSAAAGHDINYISLTGALGSIGERGGAPLPPLALAGDFGGGGVFLALGVLAGVLEARASGEGQVVDVAMVDGSATLMTLFYALRALGMWNDERGTNLLDGGAPYYRAYRTADGAYVSVGALEPQFYQELLVRLHIPQAECIDQNDVSRWPELGDQLRQAIGRKTQQELCRDFEGSDACFAPVLSMEEAPTHPHIQARQTVIEMDGVPQPAPAPRFDRTPGAVVGAPPMPGQDTDVVMAELGYSVVEIATLRSEGTIA